MNTNRPFLEHTLLKERPRKEVRHLVIHPVNPPSVMNLTRVEAGVETPIVTGTEYEVRQKADGLAREWTEKEGFKLRSDREPVFEPLPHAIALARYMGHRILYDNRAKKGMNFTGAVPLERWPGLTGKNGGGYEYAFTWTKILARPTLPPNHALNMSPESHQELLEVMQKATEIRKSVGSDDEFVLGGQNG